MSERVIGVIRLSDKTDATTSPERQRASISNAAAARNATIVGWAEDIDVSAGTGCSSIVASCGASWGSSSTRTVWPPNLTTSGWSYGPPPRPAGGP